MRSSNELNIDAVAVVIADVEGGSVSADQVFKASAILVISGSSASAPAGNLVLQGSNDPPLATGPSNWATIATTAVSGAGTYQVLSDISHQFIRAYYDNTVSIVHASLANQSLTYTALGYGAGNSITIRLLDPGANNQSLSVSVLSNAITVHLATDGGGAITSTPDLIKAAVNASVEAAALVIVTGSGSSPVTALVATPLANGRDGGAITSCRIKTIGY